MSAGLGLDLTEFQNGMQRATDLARNNTTLMSAEMKRTSREGAEALRLIDESLGIHMSRPLTRILTQEFPAFAAGLQSIFGGAVFGALATIGFEAFEKVSRSIENAQKAQEKFAESTRNEKTTFDDIIASFDKSEKLRSLTGLDKKLFQIDASSVEETHRKIDELTKALEENAKAAAAAGGWWTKFKAGVGDVTRDLFTPQSTINTEKIDAQIENFKDKLHDLARIDGLNQTHYTAAAISDELDAATRKLRQLQADQGKEITTPSVGLGGAPQTRLLVTPEELAAQQRYIDGLTKIQQTQSRGDINQGQAESEARMADYAEKQLKAQEAIAALYKEMGSSLAKLQPETDPIKKLEAEIAGFRRTAEANFREIGESAASALATSAALAGLESYEKKLDQIKIKLEADILSKQAWDLFSKPIPGLEPTGTAVPGLVMTPAPRPILGAGGTAAAQVDVFSKDQAAQLRDAAAAYAELLTPAQKYQVTQQELNILLQKGLIDQAAYTAAMQKAQEEMTKATDKLEKLLAKTNDASAGMQAFFIKLNQDAGQNGKFTFDILNKGLEGFENNTVSMLMNGKAHWQSYFNDLAAMALKFFLNKALSSLLGNIFGGMFGGAAGAGSGGGGDWGSTDIPGFAGGTDYTPGGMAWVGEQGPELLNLPAGSSVTPASAVRTGGDVHIHNYADQFRGAVVTDDLMRKADAVRMSAETKRQAVRESMANFTEVQKRSLQQR